jgi:hypothetical protein
MKDLAGCGRPAAYIHAGKPKKHADRDLAVGGILLQRQHSSMIAELSCRAQ